jgi:hypothetical protein
VYEGDDVGPIDWDSPTAATKPALWHDAEKTPDRYLLNGRIILRLCMYDGWPYWTPTPAIQFIGPLQSAEWTFFDSYGIHADSITERR